MSEKIRKILLAVDGFEQSMDAVRYVCNSVQPAKAEVVVYQVMGKVPDVFWDLARDPAWQQKIESLRAWEKQQEAIVASFMNTALALFKEAGFSPGSVATQVGRQKEGIARDIIAEARKGYDVVVIGRGKSSAEEGTPLGSVASKILSAATTFSLWLIGGKPTSDKVLIAIDSSEGGFRAVEHAGRMFSHDNNTFTLFHAIRGITVSSEGMEDIFPEAYRQQLMGDAEREIQPVMQIARDSLEKMDISPERISTKIITSVKSRAAAIVQEAKQSDHGTIVVGRRGITEVAEFSMGRVTNKLTQLAKTQALCIVV
ncbi:MAG: universal stress protein [Proteobacteria bacterium]|nr:universal stress protein [Pseudomonadota bacterium]